MERGERYHLRREGREERDKECKTENQKKEGKNGLRNKDENMMRKIYDKNTQSNNRRRG